MSNSIGDIGERIDVVQSEGAGLADFCAWFRYGGTWPPPLIPL